MSCCIPLFHNWALCQTTAAGPLALCLSLSMADPVYVLWRQVCRRMPAASSYRCRCWCTVLLEASRCASSAGHSPCIDAGAAEVKTAMGV